MLGGKYGSSSSSQRLSLKNGSKRLFKRNARKIDETKRVPAFMKKMIEMRKKGCARTIEPTSEMKSAHLCALLIENSVFQSRSYFPITLGFPFDEKARFALSFVRAS